LNLVAGIDKSRANKILELRYAKQDCSGTGGFS
jgi:hypothetical protein